MSSELQIRLLGGFSLVYGEEEVELKRRSQSLLSYLLLHRTTPLSRQQVAFTFWPDSSERQARANLRKSIYHLRAAFPALDHVLFVNGKIAWQADAPLVLDVAEFEQALARAKQAEAAGDEVARRQALVDAVERYRGDLLPV